MCIDTPHTLTHRACACAQTYGMLIYKQLGASAQEEFAKTWGVGYALNNASEWQDVAITACKAAVLIVILDAMRLTKNSSWFEEHGACVLERGQSAHGAGAGGRQLACGHAARCTARGRRGALNPVA